MTNQNQMKIKSKTLAMESRLQRKLQRSLGKGISGARKVGVNKTNLPHQLGVSQSEHAKLRVEARHLHLARMLRKGTPYLAVEETGDKYVDFQKIMDYANVSESRVAEYIYDN